MEWLLLLVVGGGGLAAKRWRSRRALRSRELAELEGIRHLADEDVTFLGEELQRLDEEVKGHELDTATRVDYQAALDAYEAAQRAVPRIRRADDVSTIIDTLSSGRYALACVQARVAGAPLPELRVPCFFNPQHGPSVANVMWTDPRRGTNVPACGQDAARVANHEVPAVRRSRSAHGRCRTGRRVSPTCPTGRGTSRALRDDVGLPGTGRRRRRWPPRWVPRWGVRRWRVPWWRVRRWRVRRWGRGRVRLGLMTAGRFAKLGPPQGHTLDGKTRAECGRRG